MAGPRDRAGFMLAPLTFPLKEMVPALVRRLKEERKGEQGDDVDEDGAADGEGPQGVRPLLVHGGVEDGGDEEEGPHRLRQHTLHNPALSQVF